MTAPSHALQSIADRLLQHEPHRAFRLRHGNVERLRRNFRRCFFRLNQDVADLGPVAVHNEQSISLRDDFGQPARGLFGSRDLFLMGSAIFLSKKRVAAEGDHREARCGSHRSSRSSGMVMQRGPPRARDNSCP